MSSGGDRFRIEEEEKERVNRPAEVTRNCEFESLGELLRLIVMTEWVDEVGLEQEDQKGRGHSINGEVLIEVDTFSEHENDGGDGPAIAEEQ